MSDPNAPYRGAPWLTNRDAEIAGEILQRQQGPPAPRSPDPRKLRRKRRWARIRLVVFGVVAGLLGVNTLYDLAVGEPIGYSLLLTAVFGSFALYQARALRAPSSR